MRQLPPMNALRIFEEVSRHLNFSHAADSLNITQGAVSRQIKLLEEYLGVSLFIRSTKGLVLTDIGIQLTPEITTAFNHMELALTKAKIPNLRKHLRIEASPTWANRYLAPRLRSFSQANHDILLTINHAVDVDQLIPAEVDCRIRYGIKTPSNHTSYLLYEEEHIAVASANLFEKNKKSPKFSQYPLLHVMYQKKRSNTWENWLNLNNQQELIKKHHALEFATLEQVIQATISGCGFAVIDKIMIEKELQQGILLPIPSKKIHGPYGYWLDIPTEKFGLPKVILFKDWLLNLENNMAVN